MNANALARRAILSLAANPLVASAVTRYGMSLGAARFVAGQRLDEAVPVVRELNRQGIKATLDCLGEGVSRPEQARQAAAAYLETLDRIAAEGLDANVSLKLTQMGLDIDPTLCRANLAAILERAAGYGNFVRIDMEDSHHTQATIDLFRELRRAHANVGLVLQAYLYRTEADLAGLHRFAAEELAAPPAMPGAGAAAAASRPAASGGGTLPPDRAGLNLRLVKGAYAEPPDMAHPAKRDVDAAFVRLVEAHLGAGHYTAVATHDEAIIRHTLDFVARRGIPREFLEFQMLYGIRRDLQQSLAHQGWTVRVYVPFGTEWYLYFMRRIAERPANLGFVLRSLLRG